MRETPAPGGPPAPEAAASRPLPRTLTPAEAWSFGLTGPLAWVISGPPIVAMLGPAGILAWLPALAVGLITNRQVRSLADRWPDAGGGLANYTARLLGGHPLLARYAAVGMLMGWASYPAAVGMVLEGLINASLAPAGLSVPGTPLRLAVTIGVFAIAFGGIRPLGLLHLAFLVPSMGLLLAFVAHGLIRAASGGAGPGTATAIDPSAADWLMAAFLALYASFGCSDTAASFAAESRRPATTLRCLGVAAALMVLVNVGGTVVIGLAAPPRGPAAEAPAAWIGAAAGPLWGEATPVLVTFLVACGCMICCASASSIAPRILHQLARDGYLAPVLAVATRRGVPVPALTWSLALSVAFLTLDYQTLLLTGGAGWFFSLLALHLGHWLRRGEPGVLWPRLSLLLFAVEAAAFVAWGVVACGPSLALGLLAPVALLAADRALRLVRWGPMLPSWWAALERRSIARARGDGLGVQVAVPILISCLALCSGWWLCSLYGPDRLSDGQWGMLAMGLIAAGFLGIAVTSWTVLRQTVALNEARADAHDFLQGALDGLVVVDDRGEILVSNPAAARLMRGSPADPAGRRLDEFLPALTGPPAGWVGHRVQEFADADGGPAVVELAVSMRSGGARAEYIVVVHDVTERARDEANLLRARDGLESLVALRTAELARANAFLEDLAATDGLTGLKNRRHFDQALARALAETEARGESASVVLLDVDHFKSYNDAFGHPAGDEVLRRVAAILLDGTRDDDLAARYGGEEFVLILPGADAEAAEASAERLRATIASSEFPCRPVTASFGVATATPGSGVGAERMLEGADRALYRSKEGGRNRVTHRRDVSPSDAHADRRRSPAPGRAGLSPGADLLPLIAGHLGLQPPCQ